MDCKQPDRQATTSLGCMARYLHLGLYATGISHSCTTGLTLGFSAAASSHVERGEGFERLESDGLRDCGTHAPYAPWQ